MNLATEIVRQTKSRGECVDSSGGVRKKREFGDLELVTNGKDVV